MLAQLHLGAARQIISFTCPYMTKCSKNTANTVLPFPPCSSFSTPPQPPNPSPFARIDRTDVFYLATVLLPCNVSCFFSQCSLLSLIPFKALTPPTAQSNVLHAVVVIFQLLGQSAAEFPRERAKYRQEGGNSSLY